MPAAKQAIDTTEEIVRLLALQLKLQLENQTQAILELHKAGFANPRIATLLNTTTDTVKVTVQRAKKGKGAAGQGGRKKAPKAKGGGG